MEDNGGDPTISPGLVRKIVLKEGRDSKRMTKEAALAAGELLRLFILEARNRAGIEAECEVEGSGTLGDNDNNGGKAMIRADHITKVAAELLMDFS